MNNSRSKKILAIIGSALLIIGVFLPFNTTLIAKLSLININPLIGLCLIADGVLGLLLGFNRTQASWIPGIAAFSLFVFTFALSIRHIDLTGLSYGAGVIILGAALLLVASSAEGKEGIGEGE